MRTYFKYLIIGWTIITIFMSWYVYTNFFLEEKYSFKRLKVITKEELAKFKADFEALPRAQEAALALQKALREREQRGISMEEFEVQQKPWSLEKSIEKFLLEHPAEVLYEEKIKYDIPKEGLIIFVVGTFSVWAVPITVFSILGLFFTRKEHPKSE